ncbi:Uncharacterized conserved protein [Janthinobacterium sp. Marseille]|nr:DUF4870 domain-containing protein [Janthinobacterium sp. Marseille]ABR90557.1 Uncharacterized conserved protein [Janthinobacterium sp. Marseille]
MNQDLVLDSSLQSAKNLAWWLYLGHAASLVFSLGAFSFIPLIINYVKREDSANTFVYSHHSWQIRSFWWYLVWMALGGVLFMTIVGIPAAFLLWTVAWLWKLYRMIKGIVDLNDNKPMP